MAWLLLHKSTVQTFQVLNFTDFRQSLQVIVEVWELCIALE